MTDRVFVTGGTGLLGRGIIERLIAEGRQVVALSRSPEAAQQLRAAGAQPVPGDVLDRDALRAGMRGCAVAYHAAGINAFCVRDPAPMFRVNIDGSRRVVQAAAEAGVRRVVYTSSAAAIGEPHGVVATEATPHRGWFLSNYERSKYEAERAVFASAAKTGVEVVCVNPSSVQGPGRASGTGKLLLDAINGRLPAIVDTRLSLVDIADCTAGHLLAEKRGAAGERYLLSGATITVREGLRLLGELTGREVRPRFVPGALAVAGATAVEAVARMRRRHPRFCREMVRTLLHGHAYDGSRATRELGLVYMPVEETLRRTLAWFAQQGLLRT